MTRYHAGLLRTRIVAEKPVYVTDVLGGAVTDWQPYSLIWGHCLSARTSEITLADARTTVIVQTVIIRSPHTLDETMRLKINKNYYDIEAIAQVNDQPDFAQCLVRYQAGRGGDQ